MHLYAAAECVFQNIRELQHPERSGAGAGRWWLYSVLSLACSVAEAHARYVGSPSAGHGYPCTRLSQNRNKDATWRDRTVAAYYHAIVRSNSTPASRQPLLWVELTLFWCRPRKVPQPYLATGQGQYTIAFTRPWHAAARTYGRCSICNALALGG